MRGEEENKGRWKEEKKKERKKTLGIKKKKKKEEEKRCSCTSFTRPVVIFWINQKCAI